MELLSEKGGEAGAVPSNRTDGPGRLTGPLAGLEFAVDGVSVVLVSGLIGSRILVGQLCPQRRHDQAGEGGMVPHFTARSHVS